MQFHLKERLPVFIFSGTMVEIWKKKMGVLD
jgi:hypothetical protein